MNPVMKLTGIASLAIGFVIGSANAAQAGSDDAMAGLALPLVKAELPAGIDIVAASEADLAGAVRRAVEAQPSMAVSIVEAVLAVSPQTAPAVAAAAASAAPDLAPEIAAAAVHVVPDLAVQIAAAVTAAVPGSGEAIEAAVAAQMAQDLADIAPAAGVEQRSPNFQLGAGGAGSPN